MDFVTIATFISLEIASGILKEQGKEIYHKVKNLLTPEELISLNLLEKYPESKELQGEIATILETHLQATPDVAKELEVLLSKLPIHETKQNTIKQKGNRNIAFQDVLKSRININGEEK